MKVSPFSIAIIAIIISLFHAQASAAEPDMLIEVFRHGARSPVGTIDSRWTN